MSDERIYRFQQILKEIATKLRLEPSLQERPRGLFELLLTLATARSGKMPAEGSSQGPWDCLVCLCSHAPSKVCPMIHSIMLR